MRVAEDNSDTVLSSLGLAVSHAMLGPAGPSSQAWVATGPRPFSPQAGPNQYLNVWDLYKYQIRGGPPSYLWALWPSSGTSGLHMPHTADMLLPLCALILAGLSHSRAKRAQVDFASVVHTRPVPSAPSSLGPAAQA